MTKTLSDAQMTANGPPRWCRVLASALLIGHFLAIMAAVTGIATGRFEPPPFCAAAHDVVRPYLQSLVLNCGYRFFAPNPGVDPVLWVRLHFHDGRTRCFEWPPLDPSPPPGVYLRDLSVPMCVCDTYTDKTGAEVLPPMSEIILSSYARHIAADPKWRDGSTGNPPVKIEFYGATHELLTPELVRDGWQFWDFRLYRIKFLGNLNAAGRRLGKARATSVSVPNLAARIIAEDIRPLIPKDGAADLSALFASQGTPMAIRQLLNDQPELLTAPPPEIQPKIQQAFLAGSDPFQEPR